MDTIMRLTDYAKRIKSPVKFIGVPKTIDNDLAITDHTPGFGSAAKYIAATNNPRRSCLRLSRGFGNRSNGAQRGLAHRGNRACKG